MLRVSIEQIRLLISKIYIDLLLSDPSTCRVIGTAPEMDASDSSDAVAAALKAFPEFSATPARNRARMLRSYNDILLANKADFAAIIVAENGKPCKQS